MRPRWLVVGVVAAGLVAGVFYARGGAAAPDVVTSPLTRGDIVEIVAATGTLEAVTTVQVGSQLSGTVQSLHADFNSLVHKGEVIARLDPSVYESQVEQARANVVRAQADVDRLAVAVDDGRAKLVRARDLFDKSLIPRTDLEAADVTVRLAEAQKSSAVAQVTQAQASLNQAEVNLEKTIITAPIDGFVIARNVDVGQTVAASLQAPTLFVIAADLTRMRVNTSIDESDVGRIQPGQIARFHVDAYPNEEFPGTVSQVRLSPIVLQNVVTYAGLIDVTNAELKLKPGMTATVDIETARRDDVLRVPGAALRFTPTSEMLAALGQPAMDRNETPGRRRAPGAGRVWVEKDGRLSPHDVAIGFSNGTFAELLTPDLAEGSKVVTTVTLPVQKTAAAAASPLLSMTPGAGRRPGL